MAISPRPARGLSFGRVHRCAQHAIEGAFLPDDPGAERILVADRPLIRADREGVVTI